MCHLIHFYDYDYFYFYICIYDVESVTTRSEDQGIHQEESAVCRQVLYKKMVDNFTEEMFSTSQEQTIYNSK